uniref:Ig-like domain-containing protein n=1 Tax=Panagrolaimus sp. ES5 TaxID=591445 RepID=A0AC34FI78_9BILA
MSTIIFVFVLTYLVFLHSGVGGDDSNTIIDRYVPLGQHFNFTCDAYERIKEKHLQVIEVQWSYRCQKSSIILDNSPNLRFIYDTNSYFLIGYDIQKEHEGVLECKVLYTNAPMEEEYVESSTINLKVQDCNENIDSNISHALRNPCQFGQCKVVSSKLGGIKHEKLYCECVEQYTGLYCDVEKSGTWWRETLYYSSTFGHFLCTGIIFLGFYCFDRSNSKERISLKEDVPDFGRIPDQPDILYPAARKRTRVRQPPTYQPPQQPPPGDPIEERLQQPPPLVAPIEEVPPQLPELRQNDGAIPIQENVVDVPIPDPPQQ